MRKASETTLQIRAMAKEIAKREGKKSQAAVGDIREILGIVSDICHEQAEWVKILVLYGSERMDRKPKPKKPKAAV